MSSTGQGNCRQPFIRYLQSSEDYWQYHQAVVANERIAQEKLLGKFPCLEDLHRDFGDIFAVHPISSNKIYNDWISRNQELFQGKSTARIIRNLDGCESGADKVLIEVQITSDPVWVQHDVKRLLDAYYLTMIGPLLHGVGAAPPQHPYPKYYLFNGGLKIDPKTLGVLSKALYVGKMRQNQKGVSGRRLTNNDLVHAIKLDPKNPFKWTVSAVEQACIDEGRINLAFLNTTELTYVKRYLKAYQAYTRNLLQGRFPDPS